ncbi:Uu.00g063470.m01.CDS01 [Anthostomella pinea]|uniref:Uu.00g063470.m01.CDS01 n=1 Tax=Anthostomella pinea TaxID=933095 RepID=A0AAI8VTC0_9PEZI|nr:Uu.00g063470.m01.CDS01 [Anthostomella pinea]
MADHQDINSILAALAQQRAPTATPNQGQPPHQVPGYHQSPTPNAYPPTMPPANQHPSYAGNYPMPSANGSMPIDLSAIRPVNSGTVSLADAVAKAKSYAAQQGLPAYERPPPGAYPSHDPRGADARHYRSRSRSPTGRRDGIRDNFDPYRDERREDRGNHARDYGRDRSMSPGMHRGRPSGTFSPRSANGRDRGGDDNNEMIEIESSLVGLIIGRQGENLRRVESETGCRVQFISSPGDPGPFRQCKISGPRQGRAEAKAQINRIIEDSGMGAIARAGLDRTHHGGGRGPPAAAVRSPSPPPLELKEGEDCMQIMVPDRTVGLIIGRGGETIRDLQERSGCHINIVGESKSVNGLRPVNLIGPVNAAAQAKEFILEIVESDSRNGNSNDGGNKMRPQKNDYGRDSAPQGGHDKINDSIYVPSEAVGMIIGKGGETIREMQNTTGCKINVSQSSGPGESEREIGLVGSHDAIDRAKRAIEDKVDAVRQKNNGGGGGRGGRQQNNRRDWDNPNYTPQGSNNQPTAVETQAPAAANGGADPYAMYGGYQAYLALWYQALAQQQQGGGPAGEMPKPPGA